ncbi:MAG: VWA domain-containing protein [Myxococcaceae bacterium]|nr:VWA domain-containing protein [Myxococcaceae bacterium]
MKRLLPLLLLAACRPETLTKTLPPDVRVDSYAQQAASRIDVLWVVDNSGSMAPRQENLAKNFQSFIDLFTRGEVDFRIAVTTTDIFKEKGAFVGNPKILTPKTPGVVAAFASNVKVGITGSPYEAGLQAAKMSLDAQAAANAPKLSMRESCLSGCQGVQTCTDACNAKSGIDFLRPDAYLYLIFVSDEEDESSDDVRYYWRSFETAKGIGNDGTVTTAAIKGPKDNTCGAAAGERYQALSDLTGGQVGSICDASFADTLKKLASNAVGLKRKFALQRKPNVSTIEVRFKYPCNENADVLTACTSVDRTACDGEAPDAVKLVCVPPQGGADGWTYEPADNVIFFSGESVPFLKAQVEFQYYEEGTGPMP